MFGCMFVIVAAFLASATIAQLSPDFYDQACPQALPMIKMVVEQAISREPRMGASLLRLHFFDCLVNGCDGSLLLDDFPGFTREKTAAHNLNSVRGFEVVDQINAAVDWAYYGSVVSCADILAIAANDLDVTLGASSYQVLLGRRDVRTASKDDANNNMPPPTLDFPALLSNFQSHGLALKGLVVLSGAYTIGMARCTTFKNQRYNETNIDSSFANAFQMQCPPTSGDNNTSPLDETTTSFDTVYFNDPTGGGGSP
ncbi:peroxidase P7-like protein [Cinnamomum micranthum f. kanehirae]|uniref:Peroxidase P7-like protein n=1 Tax=Cinnamomum micranthum f. kanehirae TaxID=337451 RepID=A0A443PN51_9MAGN|nr:peroxidase P7-like protein [Cinnamomum micranthum f. kanehirae]